MGLIDKLLGNGGLKACRTKDVTVVVGGDEVHLRVRQPTIAERDRILGRVRGRELDKPAAEVEVDAVIACAIDPATGGPAFGKEHRESLLGQPAGGWVSQVAAEAIALMAPEGGEGKA